MVKKDTIQAFSIFKHYKNKKEYQFIGIAFNTETEEDMVLYKPLYECDYEYFVRPKHEFFETLVVDGVPTPRFRDIKTPNQPGD